MRRFMMAVAMAVGSLAAPPAFAAVPTPVAVADCILAPGVYAIMGPNGEFVGILIIYPDCEQEIIPKPDLQPI